MALSASSSKGAFSSGWYDERLEQRSDLVDLEDGLGVPGGLGSWDIEGKGPPKAAANFPGTCT